MGERAIHPNTATGSRLPWRPGKGLPARLAAVLGAGYPGRMVIGLLGALLGGLLGAPAPGACAQPAPEPQPRRISLELIETLPESIERRRSFPFQADCNGNTKEMLACLWQQRDRQDQRLLPLLGGTQELELWRGVRQRVCRRAAERGSGGSIAPLLGLECELALDRALLGQITPPLAP